jgi:F0F1-type ATP synthase membrane subunit b/b'
MRRASLAITLGLAFASCALPQEPAHASESKQEIEQGDPWIWWKWANFAILAGGIGFMIYKVAPALFEQRKRAIGQAMFEAATAVRDAQTRATEIETRFTALQSEIAEIRRNAKAEMSAESDRISRETEQRLQRIQDQATQEIALIARAERDELRKYTAQLALDLAEQRLRSRLTEGTQDGLVDGFLQDLRYQVTQNAARH